MKCFLKCLPEAKSKKIMSGSKKLDVPKTRANSIRTPQQESPPMSVIKEASPSRANEKKPVGGTIFSSKSLKIHDCSKKDDISRLRRNTLAVPEQNSSTWLVNNEVPPSTACDNSRNVGGTIYTARPSKRMPCSKKEDVGQYRTSRLATHQASSEDSKRNEIPPTSTSELRLSVNGKIYTLGPEVHPELSLLRFIRDVVKLKGTKGMCYEGGCGLCTVIGIHKDPERKDLKIITLRSCQTLVYSCIGWVIITIEHLGDRYTGYDRLQIAINGFYGTQCGYCTPGFVMTMKGEMKPAKALTSREIERCLDGNICRCTGYRPILEAFKCFASDAPKELSSKLRDIEDVYEAQCSINGKKCEGRRNKSIEECAKLAFTPEKNFVIEINGIAWHYPKTVEDIYAIFKDRRNLPGKIRIVVGNTGQGIFKNDGPYTNYIVTTGVKPLYEIAFKPHLVIGANVSLTQCIEAFIHAAKNYKNYRHLNEVANHWLLVANTGVRNAGSWSGNMMMKYEHPTFVSDIFVTLIGVDAQLTIGRPDGRPIEVPALDFLSYDMSASVILSMKIPQQPDNTHLRCYKISARAVNSKAFVNACFRFHLSPKDKMKVVSAPVLVIGGINANFIRASRTEKFLQGKVLNPDSVDRAIESLGYEIEPDFVPTDPSPEFRRLVSQCLLYKAILSLLGELASDEVQSGGTKLERPVSKSKQTFDVNKDTWPVGQPTEKLESKIQISGEAEYLDDIPELPGELYGAFVQSQRATGKIQYIDASKCMELAGVVDFFSGEDIPGKNTFYVFEPKFGDDPVFADEDLKYHGQAIGLVVAKTRKIAQEGAKLVEVSYQKGEQPILTIKQAMKAKNRFFRAPGLTGSTDAIEFGSVEQALKKSKHVMEGEISFGSQYHFTMEPIAARTVPTEEGYDVWCTTQWPTEAQNVVATVLDIPANSVNIKVRRIGGGYGGKISRAHLVAAASAIAAHKLKRPVRIALDIEAQMTLVGWREPYLAKYKVGFDNKGILNAVNVDICSDVGLVANENSAFVAAHAIPSVYFCPNWRIQGYYAQTDTPANTWCRTPGHVEAIGTIENIMERIAHVVRKDPQEIRELNFTSKNRQHFLSERKEENLIKTKIFPLLMKDAQIEARKRAVEEFNETNRWKKRGLSLIPMLFPYDVVPFFVFNVQVVIYEHDGSVAVMHGGVEMGQGINTKVAQVAARILSVPLYFVKVKPTDNFTAANSAVTGGSFGSDVNAHGVKICCERLRTRIDEVAKRKKIKQTLDNWQDLIKECFADQVDLSERYCTFSNEHPKGYDIWGAACTEVELDVLTGQFLILRSDIVEDCGRSLNPYIDMGQIEGAFVMGLGFCTSEEVKHDPETGAKLTIGTANYKPPSSHDIPVDFRVSFLPKGDNENGGVLRSKATGEPPLCLSYSVVTALRQAIMSKRADDGNAEWFDMDIPLTVEKIHELCNIDPGQFDL